MAVIDYEMPASWNDKGMDWEDPDPRNADYLMAIRQALFERVYASRFYIGYNVKGGFNFRPDDPEEEGGG